MPAPTAYDPNSPLPPKLQSVRKLLVSVFSTGAALVTFLTTGDPTAVEAISAIGAFVAANYGVYQAANATPPLI